MVRCTWLRPKTITITNDDAKNCGGYAVFARICGVMNILGNLPGYLDSTETCCEEQIVKDPKAGFYKGDTISHTFNWDCTDAYIVSDDMTLRLTGYEKYNVSKYIIIYDI